MNVLQSAQKFFRNKLRDDEGWFRQGKFTPRQQIKDIGQIRAPSGVKLKDVPKTWMQSFGQSRNLPGRLMNIGTSAFLRAGSFGLLQPQAPRATTVPEKFFAGLGGVTGMFSPASPAGKVVRGLEGIGSRGVKRLLPKTAPRLFQKVLPAIGAETTQALGYAGAGTVAGLAGFRPGYNLKKELPADIAYGLAFRGAGGLISPSVKRFGRLYESDIKNVEEIMQGLSKDKKAGKLNITFRRAAEQDAEAYRKAFKLTGKKEWKKMGLESKFKMIKDKMVDLRASGEGIQMGIVDKRLRTKPEQVLNVERLDLSPEAKRVVQAVEGTEPRVRLKHKDIQKLAKEVTGDERVRLKDKTAKNIAEQLNTRKKLVSLTKEFENLRAGGASRAKLEAKMAEIGNLSRIARAQGTDVARKLEARKIMASELDTPMQMVFKLMDNAGVKQKDYLKEAVDVDFNNARAVTEFYRKHVPSKFGEWLDEFRYTNMLSSPKTHVKNFISNLIQTAVQPVRKTVAGGYDWAISGLTGRERTQFASEATPFVKHALTSLPDAWSNAVKKVSGESEITRPDLKHMPSGNTFMRLYSTPLRVLEAGDAFFQTILGEGQKGALKYRAGRLKTKLSDAELARQAKEYASEVVFRGELNKQGQGWILNAIDGLTSLINKTRHSKSGVVRGAGKLLIPFVQTPMNILKQGVEYSPLEFVNMVKSGGDIPDQLAKATIGSMVMAGAGTIITGGNSTWETPTGTKEREAFYAAGKQPYSLKIGNKWVSYSQLGPLSYPIAIAGAINEALKERGDDELASVTAGKIVAMVGGFFTDQSYMRSVGDIIDAMRGDKYKQTRMLANVPTQLVPYKSFIGWVNRMIDPIYRKVDWSDGIPKAIAQSIQRDIPFVSQGLKPYTNPLGQPSERQFPMLNAFSPFNITEEKEQFTNIYNKIVGDRRARKAVKNAKESIKAGTGTREIDGKLMFLENDEVVTLDYGKIENMPSGNAIERVKKNKAKYTFIGKLMESGADDVDIDAILKKLNVSREDAEYYNIARNTNDAKSAYVFDVIQGVQSREELMRLLVNGRRKVNGKLVVADGVVDDLYNADVITYAEKKYLKSLRQNKFGKLTIGRAKGTGVRKPQFKKTAPVHVSRVKLPARSNVVNQAKPLKLKVNIKRTVPRVRLKTR